MLTEALPPIFGGAMYQALRLADELRRLKLEIILLGRRPDRAFKLEPTFNGFPVFRVGVGMPHSGKWTKLRALTGYLTVLFRERRHYKILHIHGPYYLILAAGVFARTILRKKLVLKLTSINFDSPEAIKKQNYGRLTWYFYKKADAYACISTAQYQECLNHGLPSEKLFRTPNGVDTNRFRPVQSTLERDQIIERLELPKQSRYAVFIGSIEKLKGIDLLVEIAGAVCNQHPDVKFLLVGPDGRTELERHIDPAYVNRIRSRIEALGLNDRVLLLGHRTNTEDYLKAANVFVFTSRSEGFGTVVIEAMSTGLPCVALDIPGVTRDIISTGHDGVIISGEDVPTFSSAINRILNESEYAAQIGQAARQTVLHKFDMPAVAKRYVDMYKAILSEGR